MGINAKAYENILNKVFEQLVVNTDDNVITSIQNTNNPKIGFTDNVTKIILDTVKDSIPEMWIYFIECLDDKNLNDKTYKARLEGKSNSDIWADLSDEEKNTLSALIVAKIIYDIRHDAGLKAKINRLVDNILIFSEVFRNG